MLSVAEDFYNDVFVANGGEYLFGTAITGLVMEDGRVVGVQATPKDGDPLLVKANKGVILATGGMCNNIEMLKRYCPSGLYRCMVSNASTNDNGDGIRLGFGAGAQFDGYNNHGHFDGGIEGVDWNQTRRVRGRHPDSAPALAADRHPGHPRGLQRHQRLRGHGRAHHGHARVEGVQLLRRQLGRILRRLRAAHVPRPHAARHGEPGALERHARSRLPQRRERSHFRRAHQAGEHARRGLAEALGIAPELVANAFEEWNDMVASGDGSAYGYQPEWLHPLDTPPYYGQALGAMMYSTRASLSVDENQQVVARDGRVIPGLYAAGQTSGRPATCGARDVGYAAVSAFNAANHLDANA